MVWTDGLSGRRAVYGHVITKFSRMGSILYFLTHGGPLARFARKSSVMKPRCCSCYSELPDCVKVFGCGLIGHFCWPVRSKQSKKRDIAKPSDGPNNYCNLLTAE